MIENIAPAEAPSYPVILVVDDETTVRTITARMLQRIGYQVVTAADGPDGIERFREHAGQVLCVLVDMSMPQMSGEATCQSIKAIDPAARLVLMSGHAEGQLASDLQYLDLAGFLQKPFNLDQLRTLVARVVNAAE